MNGINTKGPAQLNPHQLKQMRETLDHLGLSKPKAHVQEKHLGQKDFMKLMLAQMNHQDPTKPMDNGDFLAQMAQFSSVKGLKDLKDSFSSLATSLQSSQALQASSMVGRTVLVPGKTSELVDNGSLTGAVDIPNSTAGVKVNILDAGGELVKTLDLGSQKKGVAHFNWDGVLDKKAPDGTFMKAKPGKYTVQAQMQTGGKPQAVNTLIADKVQSVSLGKPGEPVTLHLAGEGKTSLADIKQIM